MTRRAVRLLVCDLDGTLLDSEGAAVPDLLTAMSALVAAGAVVTVCTGRPYAAACRLLSRAGLRPSLLASYHGAFIVDARHRCLRHLRVPAPEASRTAAVLAAHGLELTLYEGARRRPLDVVHDRRVPAATRIIAEGGAVAIAAALADAVAGGLRAARIDRPTGTRLDVRHRLALKGEALSFLARSLHVPLAETVAIGDDVTDAAMLRCAGLAVAVGAADSPLAHLADTVVASGDLGSFLWSLVPSAAKRGPSPET